MSALNVQEWSTNSRLRNMPQAAFTAADVVALYLHRDVFENALADEDLEKYCSSRLAETAQCKTV